MGHHWIPQYYLRGFATSADPDEIVVYTKGSHDVRVLPIKVVAQSPKLYLDVVELTCRRRLRVRLTQFSAN
jgi:hypothetical protein